jgi:hypothetical protein
MRLPFYNFELPVITDSLKSRSLNHEPILQFLVKKYIMKIIVSIF